MITNSKRIIEIAILSIEIGNNQTKYLTIYNNSIPSKLAYNFCLEYNLDYESLKKLTYEIKNLITETNKKMQFNKSFDKIQGCSKEIIQIKKNKSVNYSPIRLNESINEEKKYNFIDITKMIKKPFEFEFKIKVNEKQNIKEEKTNNDNNINYINKNIKNNNKEINKSSYLSPTQSYKHKIRNQKLKINKSYENKSNKVMNNTEIKIANIKNEKKEKINYGEKLYDKCMKMKKISIEKIKNEINIEKKKELIECTFKPKINSINIKCFKNNSSKKEEKSKSSEKNEIKKIKQVNSLIENKIKLEKIDSNEKHKKRPKTARKDNEIPIYERLYNLHSQKKEKEKNNKEQLFKPKINNNYIKKLKNKSFKERQIIYSAKSIERKKNLEKQINAKYDTKTGQKLFYPSINKNKNYNKKLNKYYSISLDKKSRILKKEKLKKEINTMTKKQSIFKANTKSDNMFENVIIKSFKKIFSTLDTNLKGEISIFNYNTKNLPNSIKKIITPIFNKIDSTSKVFNETTFINECRKIYKNLDYYSKKEIYKFSEENEQNDLYSFSCLKTNQDSDKDLNKINKKEHCLTNDTNKENENDNNNNKKLYANDYYINGKYSRIYERFYNNKTFNKEKRTKFFDNLIIQRDNIIF